MLFIRNGVLVLLNDGVELPVTIDALIQAIVILFVTLAIVISNTLVILSLILMPGPKDLICHYLLSLAVSDLLSGILVTPLSVYPAITRYWPFGDVLCRFSGYLIASLWSVNVYTLMWVAVDRYVAVRRPLRYEVLQTKIRCQCWALFSWLVSSCLCLPPVLHMAKPKFDPHFCACMLDWSGNIPYSATFAVLLMGPSSTTIIYSYYYIFRTVRRLRPCLKVPSSALAENMANPHHAMAFVLTLVFWISWIPWITYGAYKIYFKRSIPVPYIDFALFWIGMLSYFWKGIIYVTMSPSFRESIKLICTSHCCRYHTSYPELV